MSARLAAVPGVVLVAVAAAMWGTDPIIRKTMSFSTTATTIVFGEHVVLVALTLPLLLPALRSLLRAGWRFVVAAVLVGAGASAVATILFTDALIGHKDFITPVVIQKVQPLVAVAGAAVILGERPRARFAWFLLPALGGFWLVNQAHPLDPSAKGLVVIAEATGAAVLWALGTVLGRYLSREVEFQHILALALYYFGLKRTPAMMASLAELTYPVIAVIAGIYAYSQHLRWTQWIGVAIILGTVTLLPVQRRRKVVELQPRDAALAAA